MKDRWRIYVWALLTGGILAGLYAYGTYARIRRQDRRAAAEKRQREEAQKEWQRVQDEMRQRIQKDRE